MGNYSTSFKFHHMASGDVKDVFQFQSIQSQEKNEFIMDSPLQDERLRLLITRVHS